MIVVDDQEMLLRIMGGLIQTNYNKMAMDLFNASILIRNEPNHDLKYNQA